MKKITKSTILLQGSKIYYPEEIYGVLCWIDKNPTGFSKGEWMYNEPHNSELTYRFNYDIDSYAIGNKIIAQSQLQFEGVPVINPYTEREIILDQSMINLIKSGNVTYNDNSIVYSLPQVFIFREGKWYVTIDDNNKYTQKDINKVFGLGAANNAIGEPSFQQVIEELNSVSIIEIDNQFKILNYE